MTSVFGVVRKFLGEYESQTPKKLKVIDAYLAYVFFTGVVQFVYCCLVGTFPFNSFLSGFISSVGCFILGGYHQINLCYPLWTHLQISKNWYVLILFDLVSVCLRIQVNPENKSLFSEISQERAFADFVLAHLMLHLVVMNFIG